MQKSHPTGWLFCVYRVAFCIHSPINSCIHSTIHGTIHSPKQHRPDAWTVVIARSLVDHGCMIGDRWGVSDDETLRSYPCDDFVASPVLQAWRGVHVKAPAEAVWPWVAQVRLAPYSYDWIDNLGRRSPQSWQAFPNLESEKISPPLVGASGAGSSRSIQGST
jgi:hypothetical protein